MNDETQSPELISDEQKTILDTRSTAFEKDQNLGAEWHLLKEQLKED